MNTFAILASYGDLADIAIHSRPLEWNPEVTDPNMNLYTWLEHWCAVAVGPWYETHGKLEIAHGYRAPPDFDPWCYVACYPECLAHFWDAVNQTLNENLVCFAWIVHGRHSGLAKNPFNLLRSNAEQHLALIHILYGKRVVICGNSPQFPHETKSFQKSDNDVIVRFNKGALVSDRFPPDIVVVNNVIARKMQAKLSRLRAPLVCMQGPLDGCVHLPVNSSVCTSSHPLTSGMLFLLWLVHSCRCYESIKIAGFNMSDPGTKAHWFDREEFPGGSAMHNAQFETALLQHMLATQSYRMSRIV